MPDRRLSAADGPRVRLRPARDRDAPVVEALRPERDLEGEFSVICRVSTDEAIGVLQYQFGEPSGDWTKITWVGLVEEERRWGLGQDAVRLFEEEAWRLGVRAFRTAVPATQGLALFFWLRLGYRPLDSREDSHDHRLLDMVREVG